MQFLLNAHCFHMILKSKNPKPNHPKLWTDPIYTFPSSVSSCLISLPLTTPKRPGNVSVLWQWWDLWRLVRRFLGCTGIKRPAPYLICSASRLCVHKLQRILGSEVQESEQKTLRWQTEGTAVYWCRCVNWGSWLLVYIEGLMIWRYLGRKGSHQFQNFLEEKNWKQT